MKKSVMLNRVSQDLYRLRLALTLLFIYAVTTQLLFQTVCPFAIFTGLACPACGMTRAVFLLLSGKITVSIALHPMAPLWLIYILFLAYFRYVQGKNAPFTRLLCIVLCLLTLTLYCFRLAAGGLPEVPGPGVLQLVSGSCQSADQFRPPTEYPATGLSYDLFFS